MRSLVFTTLAVGMLTVACAPKSPPASPTPAPPAAAPAPAPAPPQPAAAAPTSTPAPAATPPAATPGSAAAAEPGGGGGRGGRGNPPPPPPPPPKVMPAPVKPIVAATAPTPDPRVGLAAGRWDAAQAAWNIRLVSTTPPDGKFLGV